MKKLNWLTKRFGSMVACMALVMAQVSSTQASFIFYQDKVPEALETLKKKD